MSAAMRDAAPLTGNNAIGRKRFGRVLCFFALVFALTACRSEAPPDVDDGEHECRNAEQWRAWDELLKKYPNDQDILSLYALRIGLCAMIERKQIAPETGIELFERAHQIVIGKTIERNAAGKKKSEM